MPNVPTYWFQGPTVLPTTPGMHRIAWDLRYASPPALPYSYSGNLITYAEYTLNWHAVKGRMPRELPLGPMAIPGTYQVRLTANGQTYTQDLTIENDPRIPITQAGLVKQLDLEQRMASGIAVSTAVFTQLRSAAGVLARDEAQAKKAPTPPTQLLALAQSFEDSVATITGESTRTFGPGNQEPAEQQAADDAANGDADDPDAAPASVEAPQGFGRANRDLVRHIEDSEIADLDPTPSNVAAVDASCESIDQALASLQRLESTTLPQLNAALQAAHLTPVPAVTAPAAPGCGASANH